MCEYIEECFYNKIPLLKNFYNKALLLFNQYMIIGGMPQSFVAFLESNQFNDSEEAKREILNLYRNDIEIDFLITNKSVLNYKIIPIEVKYSTKYQTKSLDRFIEKYKSRIDTAYMIHPRNLSIKDNGIVCIPSYMAFCL